MGLWNSNRGLSVAEQEMLIAERIAKSQERKQKLISGTKLVGKETLGTIKSVADPSARYKLGRSVGEAALTGMQQQPTFSREQEMIGQMFGQGDRIWGTNNKPVTINHDLNSGRRDPWDETAGMFGFGINGERSGLF